MVKRVLSTGKVYFIILFSLFLNGCNDEGAFKNNTVASIPFSVTFVSNDGGEVSPNRVKVSAGDKASFTVKVFDGYVIESLSLLEGDCPISIGSLTNNPSVEVTYEIGPVNSDCSFLVDFTSDNSQSEMPVLITHNYVYIEIQSGSGILLLKEDGDELQSTHFYPTPDKPIPFWVKPTDGYRLANIGVSDREACKVSPAADLNNGALLAYTVTSNQGRCDVAINFEPFDDAGIGLPIITNYVDIAIKDGSGTFILVEGGDELQSAHFYPTVGEATPFWVKPSDGYRLADIGVSAREACKVSPAADLNKGALLAYTVTSNQGKCDVAINFEPFDDAGIGLPIITNYVDMAIKKGPGAFLLVEGGDELQSAHFYPTIGEATPFWVKPLSGYRLADIGVSDRDACKVSPAADLNKGALLAYTVTSNQGRCDIAINFEPFNDAGVDLPLITNYVDMSIKVGSGAFLLVEGGDELQSAHFYPTIGEATPFWVKPSSGYRLADIGVSDRNACKVSPAADLNKGALLAYTVTSNQGRCDIAINFEPFDDASIDLPIIANYVDMAITDGSGIFLLVEGGDELHSAHFYPTIGEATPFWVKPSDGYRLADIGVSDREACKIDPADDLNNGALLAYTVISNQGRCDVAINFEPFDGADIGLPAIANYVDMAITDGSGTFFLLEDGDELQSAHFYPAIGEATPFWVKPSDGYRLDEFGVTGAGCSLFPAANLNMGSAFAYTVTSNYGGCDISINFELFDGTDISRPTLNNSVVISTEDDSKGTFLLQENGDELHWTRFYPQSGEVTPFWIKPSDGYHLTSLHIEDEESCVILPAINNSNNLLLAYTVTSFKNTCDIDINFGLNTYAINVTKIGSGEATINPLPFGVEHGKQVTFSVIPKEGSRILNVQACGEDIMPENGQPEEPYSRNTYRTASIYEDCEIIIKSERYFNILLDSNSLGTVEILSILNADGTPDVNSDYTDREAHVSLEQTIVFSATAASNYIVRDMFSDNPNECGVPELNSENRYETKSISSDCNFHVVFGDPITLLTCNGLNYTTPDEIDTYANSNQDWQDTLIVVNNTTLKIAVDKGLLSKGIKFYTHCVTDMSLLFKDNANFNLNINDWDTTNVTDMSEMFSGAE
ncbi:BspA family leucine-rich repeat surface protein, partial [Vibrio sagamiensis]|uniref:BspA family leucine-rich repeat surface protein n=3 Tax=Vibrio sagamiensis TaxID=512650 RepID=UPI0016497DE0